MRDARQPGETYSGDVLLDSALIEGADGNVPGTVEIRNLRLTVPDFGPTSARATCLSTSPSSNVEAPVVAEPSPAPDEGG